MRRILTICFIFVVASVETSRARVWRVERDGSGDFATLQPAADSAAPGDTLLLGLGRYTETSLFPFDDSTIGEAYLGVQVDSLTIVGVDRSGVVIGPDEPDFEGFDPKGIAVRMGHVTRLRVANLTIENVREGARLFGACTVDSVSVSGCGIGVLSLPGSDTVVSNSLIESSTVRGMSVVGAVLCTVVDTRFRSHGIAFNASWTSESVIRNCTFDESQVGVQFDQGASGVVDRTTLDCSFAVIAVLIQSHATVRHSRLSGSGTSAIVDDYSSLSGNHNRFAATTPNTFLFTGDSTADLKDNDIRLADETTIRLDGYSLLPETKFLNLTNNYWGTTDLDTLAAQIHDGNDDAAIDGFVLFEPVLDQSVSVVSQTLGQLKARFRD